MLEKDPINQEAARRYSEHKDLSKKMGKSAMRFAKMDYRLRSAKFNHENGIAGATEKKIEKAERAAEIARDNLGLAKDIVDVQVERSSSWATENHDQLVDAAKDSAAAAGIEVVINQEQHQ